jgi:hypothetical protein
LGVVKRPQIAVVLPEAGSRAYRVAAELAGRVAGSGCDVVTIEPRRAQAPALAEAGQEGLVTRYVLDLPTDEPALFGCTAAEQLVVDLLGDRAVDAVHLHWADELAVVPLVEKVWLLGLPQVVTVHPAWEPLPGADPTRAELGRRLGSDLAALADVVCVPDHRTAADLVDAERLAAEPRVLDHSRNAGRGWAEHYKVLVGELAPPEAGGLVSVIVTTYQRHAALRDCLTALTRQTLPKDRYEVIVVDDASEPSAAGVVAAFADQLDVRFVRLDTNVGLGHARNVGLDAARGDILFFLDDDDEPAPRCLAEHVRTHTEYADRIEAVIGWTGPTHDNATTVEAHVAFRSGIYMNHTGLYHLEAGGWFRFWGGRSSIRREALGGQRFELPFCEDADFAYRVSQQGKLRVAHNRHAVQRVRIGLGLETVLRRTSRMAQARAQLIERFPELARHQPFRPQPYERNLAEQLPYRAGARLRTLTVGAVAPLEVLRRTPDDLSAGSRLDRLVNDLGLVATVESSLGWQLGRLRIRVRQQGRPLRLGISALSPQLGELTRELTDVPADNLHLVIGVPEGTDPDVLGDALAPVRADLARLPAEVRPFPDADAFWSACDVMATPLPPATGYQPARHALTLPRGPIAEAVPRLVSDRDLVGNFR